MLQIPAWDKQIEVEDLDEDGKIIWGVANYIEEHGWCQDSYNIGRNVCILGAYHALGISEGHQSLKRIADFLGTGACGIGHAVVDYNDTLGRTKEEVITMLKQAARSK